MNTKVVSLFALLWLFVLVARAQGLPQEGKYYTIAMKTNAAMYMAEMSDGSLGVTGYDKTQRIFWEFVSTGTDNCFYMRNATTKRYVTSCAGEQKERIYTSDSPTEYYVAINGANVRFTSTDCANYDKTGSSPNGLNKDGASENVIVWKAGAENGNSWWTLAESEYLYEARPVSPHSDYMMRAQIYDNPCATAADIYITYLRAKTEDSDELRYPSGGGAAAKPAEAFQIYTKSKGLVRRGADFIGEIRCNQVPQEGDSLYIYFDFDRNGVFETCVKPELRRTMSFRVTVPEDALLGQSRMRVRLTNNGLSGADDESCGQIIDFVLRVVEGEATAIQTVDAAKDVRLAVTGRTLRAESSLGVARLEVFSSEGKRIAVAKDNVCSLAGVPSGVYIVKVYTARHERIYVEKVLIK